MSDNRNNRDYNNQRNRSNNNYRNSNYNPNNPQKKRPSQQSQSQQSKGLGLSSNVKGIIAIMLTFLVVAIVIMIFAKSLFINDNTEPAVTGKITSTEYVPPKTTTTTEQQKETKKSAKKTAAEEEKEDDGEEGVTINCISAVYLHPEPNSSSANLATIPSGAQCTFYRNENGWYYVEYNGIEGYAWNTFFDAPQTNG